MTITWSSSLFDDDEVIVTIIVRSLIHEAEKFYDQPSGLGQSSSEFVLVPSDKVVDPALRLHPERNPYFL